MPGTRKPAASASSIPDPFNPSPSEPEGNAGVLMLLGELRGQVRELIHTIGNMSMKVDGIGTEVTKHSALIDQVKDHEVRLIVLEKDKDRRDGAMGLGAWLFKSPLIGWIVSAAAIIYAVLESKPRG